MVARKWAQIFTCSMFLVSSACAEEVTLSEDDHVMFALYRNDNDNNVIYYVTTDGKCAITGVEACWRMDAEDGHYEELGILEPLAYGIDGLTRKSDEVWTFYIAPLPEKTIEATVISEPTDDPEVVNCNFVGISIIDRQRAILNTVDVDNEGRKVHSVSLYATSVSSATPVSETVKP